MKVGQKEYATPLRIVHDPTSTFTEAERRLRHAAAMDLYKMHEDLAAIVADIMSRQKLLKDSIAKVPQERKKKGLQAEVDQLESLRAELIPTKQTSIFADETRLREDITEVYVAVCSNEQAPTNLQLDRIKDLRGKVDDARKKLDGMISGKGSRGHGSR